MPALRTMSKYHEFDVYMPLVSNAGANYPVTTVARYKKMIVDEFGGVTDFKHRSEGTWRIGPVTFRDQLVLWRVLSKNKIRARHFLAALKKRMERELGQQQILIVQREVFILEGSRPRPQAK